jgi:hypothetical protein
VDFCCTKETVSAIRALLSDELLRSARRWLSSEDAARQRDGNARLVLYCNPVTMQLTATMEDKKMLPKTAKR